MAIPPAIDFMISPALKVYFLLDLADAANTIANTDETNAIQDAGGPVRYSTRYGFKDS